jgi:hypothetical protein
MVKQYPHTLKLSAAGSATEDAEGNWSTPAPALTERVCRYEPSDGRNGGVIQAADGEQVSYNGVVYMPLSSSIAFGATVEVWEADSAGLEVLKAKGTVKRFDRGQLNQKVWL